MATTYDAWYYTEGSAINGLDDPYEIGEVAWNACEALKPSPNTASAEIAAAEKLCGIYFDIAASCIGEDAVRKRVRQLRTAQPEMAPCRQCNGRRTSRHWLHCPMCGAALPEVPLSGGA